MFTKLANKFNVENFNNFFPNIIRVFSIIAFVCLSFGLYYALFASPADYQQGEFVRIMYVHVPSAWASVMIYSIIGLSSLAYLIWRNQLLAMVTKHSVSTGACFCMITLVSGSIWGKPVWGTWWEWDARLTSMLILFFLYLGLLMIFKSSESSQRENLAPYVLAIIGLLNIPIIKFSVKLWTNLHQPASIIRSKGIAIDGSMLRPLFLIFFFSVAFYIILLAIKIKTEMLTKKNIRKI